jgi:hypothetical protein
MSGGSLQLREYPGDIVRLSCEKCGALKAFSVGAACFGGCSQNIGVLSQAALQHFGHFYWASSRLWLCHSAAVVNLRQLIWCSTNC